MKEPQYVSNVSLLYEHLLAVHNINALVSADCASMPIDRKSVV